MSILTKTYLLFGALLAGISKFPPLSWENFLAILTLVILLAYYRLGVDEQRRQKEIKDKMGDDDGRF